MAATWVPVAGLAPVTPPLLLPPLTAAGYEEAAAQGHVAGATWRPRTPVPSISAQPLLQAKRRRLRKAMWLGPHAARKHPYLLCLHSPCRRLRGGGCAVPGRGSECRLVNLYYICNLLSRLLQATRRPPPRAGVRVSMPPGQPAQELYRLSRLVLQDTRRPLPRAWSRASRPPGTLAQDRYRLSCLLQATRRRLRRALLRA